MKPGDRVRVNRGEHEGRTGTVTDVTARHAAVRDILRPSVTRTRLLARLAVPPGYHAVQLDGSMLVAGELAVFSEGCLIPVGGAIAGGARVPLLSYLSAIECAARAGDTTPRSILAITGKLREVLGLLHDVGALALGALSYGESPAEHDYERRLAAALEIEVPQ